MEGERDRSSPVKLSGSSLPVKLSGSSLPVKLSGSILLNRAAIWALFETIWAGADLTVNNQTRKEQTTDWRIHKASENFHDPRKTGIFIQCF